MSSSPRSRSPVTRLLFAVSPVRRMLGYWARALRRRDGNGGPARYYYYSPRGQRAPEASDDQLEPVDPPDEAYSRVTNPERFQSLHSAAITMVVRLEETFHVHRVEEYGLDEELEGIRAVVRPTVRLTPVNVNVAPITIAFSDFPGLFVRVGWWVTKSFPVCGCDACDESAPDEIERLTELVGVVTGGGFQEAVQCPKGPFARHCGRKSEFRAPTHIGSGKSRITRARARQMTGGARTLKLDWQPWPHRQAPTDD